MQHVVLSDYLLSLVHFQGSFMLKICQYVTLVLLPNNICCLLAHSIYSFISWWTAGLFPLFGYYKQHCYKHSVQVYVEICVSTFGRVSLGVDMLGHMITLGLRLGRTYKFSKATTIFYLPNSSIFRVQFGHIPANTCYCLSLL